MLKKLLIISTTLIFIALIVSPILNIVNHSTSSGLVFAQDDGGDGGGDSGGDGGDSGGGDDSGGDGGEGEGEGGEGGGGDEGGGEEGEEGEEAGEEAAAQEQAAEGLSMISENIGSFLSGMSSGLSEFTNAFGGAVGSFGGFGGGWNFSPGGESGFGNLGGGGFGPMTGYGLGGYTAPSGPIQGAAGSSYTGPNGFPGVADGGRTSGGLPTGSAAGAPNAPEGMYTDVENGTNVFDASMGGWVTANNPGAGPGSGGAEAGLDTGDSDSGVSDPGHGGGGYVPPPTSGSPVQTLTSIISAGCNGIYPLVRYDFTASYSPTTLKFEVWRHRRDLDNWTLIRDVGAPGSYLDRTLDSNSYQVTYVEYFIRRIDNTYGNLDTNHIQVNVQNCNPVSSPTPTPTPTPIPNPTPPSLPPQPFYIYQPSPSCGSNNLTSTASVTWDRSVNANRYILYRYRSGKDGDWVERFTLEGQMPNQSYIYPDSLDPDDYKYPTYYFIRAFNSTTGQSLNSTFRNDPLKYTTDPPIIPLNCTPPSAFFVSVPQPVCANTSPRVNLTWDRSEFATFYEVYRNRQGKDGAESWVTISPPAAIPQFSSSQYTFTDDRLESNDYNYPTYYFVRAVNQTTQAVRNSTYRLDPNQYSTNPPVNTLDCNLPVVNLSVDGLPASDIPYTLEYDRSAALSYSNDHVTYCDRLSNIAGRAPPQDPNWTGRVSGASAKTGGPVPTIKHRNPPTSQATYTLSCTNQNLDPSIQTSSAQQVVTIKVKPKTPPFIQTTGGDVHTQGRIVVPSDKPTPVP